MKLATFFSGIGSPERALKRMEEFLKSKGIEIECVSWCENNPYAIKSFCAIHDEKEENNLGDIREVDETKLNDFDLLVAGFPCQDISLAGNRKGLAEGSDTRSSLVWKTLEIVEYKKPKYVILENVKNLASEQFEDDRLKLFKKLEDSGFICYSQVLNAKDYGIPQNRERLFIVGIRSDVDKGFTFPSPIPLKLRLKDMLEDEVEEKYYLSEKALQGILNSEFTQKKEQIQDKNGVCGTILSRDYKDPKCIEEDIEVFDFRYDEGVRGRVEKGVCPTLTCKTGTAGISGQPLIKQLSRGYNKGGEHGICPTISGNAFEQNNFVIGIQQTNAIVAGQFQPKDRFYNKNEKEREEQFETRKDDLSNAILTNDRKNMLQDNHRIRKLTPLECYRLMGFTDSDFYKAKYNQDYQVIMEIMNSNWSLKKKLEFVSKYKEKQSNTQLYKQAGNSIVVNVLEHIFKSLFDDTPRSIFAFEF